MLKILELINNWIEKFETFLIVLILGIMVLLAFIQVILRNVFAEGILWGDILLRHLVLWVGFIGASLATREEKHINIDLFTRFLSKGLKEFVRIITNIFAAFICAVLTYAAQNFVLDEKVMGTTIFNDIPVWYFQVIIPFGFMVMSFRFLVLALHNFSTLLGKKS